MDRPMEGQDCLYDSLPEIRDRSSSSREDFLGSFFLSAGNNSSPTPTLKALNLCKRDECNREKIKNSVKICRCRDSVQWAWDSNSKSENVELLNENRVIKFHKRYSNGTAIVRSTEPMTDNQYYWEVKLTYPVYGTDVMIGIGTSEAEIKYHQNRFVSLLGMNNKTWGLSYTGVFHHNGQPRLYATGFGQGNIIGVHLDLWRGTLSFYKDRKHLGVASTGLNGKTLYAMASSTAARSGMRMIRSCSFPSSLQFLCCSKLREIVPDDKNVLDVIEVPPGLRQFLESKLSWLLNKRCLEKDIPICCPVDDAQSDDEDISHESSVRSIFGEGGQFVIIGPVLMRNYNRHQQTITCQNQERAAPSDREAKRRRCSYNYTVGLSDEDSD